MKTSKQNIERSRANFRKIIDWKYATTKKQQSIIAFVTKATSDYFVGTASQIAKRCPALFEHFSYLLDDPKTYCWTIEFTTYRRARGYFGSSFYPVKLR